MTYTHNRTPAVIPPRVLRAFTPPTISYAAQAALDMTRAAKVRAKSGTGETAVEATDRRAGWFQTVSRILASGPATTARLASDWGISRTAAGNRCASLCNFGYMQKIKPEVGQTLWRAVPQ